MIFNSLAFLVFAAVVVSLFWALRSDRLRLSLLFAAKTEFLKWNNGGNRGEALLFTKWLAEKWCVDGVAR